MESISFKVSARTHEGIRENADTVAKAYFGDVEYVMRTNAKPLVQAYGKPIPVMWEASVEAHIRSEWDNIDF